MGLENQAWLSSTLSRCEDGNSDGGTDGEVEMMVMAEMPMMVVI